MTMAQVFLRTRATWSSDEARDWTSSLRGQGLGLAIVQDMLEAYDRRLTLETSALGGLRVVF